MDQSSQQSNPPISVARIFGWECTLNGDSGVSPPENVLDPRLPYRSFRA